MSLAQKLYPSPSPAVIPSTELWKQQTAVCEGKVSSKEAPDWVMHFSPLISYLATPGYELVQVKSQQCIYRMKVLSIHLGWIKCTLKAVISDSFPALKFNQIASWILKISSQKLHALEKNRINQKRVSGSFQRSSLVMPYISFFSCGNIRFFLVTEEFKNWIEKSIHLWKWCEWLCGEKTILSQTG